MTLSDTVNWSFQNSLYQLKPINTKSKQISVERLKENTNESLNEWLELEYNQKISLYTEKTVSYTEQNRTNTDCRIWLVFSYFVTRFMFSLECTCIQTQQSCIKGRHRASGGLSDEIRCPGKLFITGQHLLMLKHLLTLKCSIISEHLKTMNTQTNPNF